jgi:hypothetical protein
MGLCCNFDSCFQYYKKTQTSVMNSMFISLCEFFVLLEYDEMNYSLVIWSFLQCILKCRFWLYEITMNLMF